MGKKYLFVQILISILVNFIASKITYAEKKVEELAEVTVTATRTEIEIEKAPASIGIIKKEEIEKIKNIKTLDDLVNEVPGVYVHRTRVVVDTPTDAISIRGFSGYRRNLVMLDGIPLNGPQGGELKLSGIRFEDIDRTEVVKGPFSALYGGLAMGGVINFISSMPNKREITIKAGYGSSFDRGKGLDDLKRIYLSYGDKIKDLSFFVSYGHEALNGFPNNLVLTRTQPPSNVSGWKFTTTSSKEPRYIVGDTGDHRGWNQNFTLRVGYNPNNSTSIKVFLMKVWGDAKYDAPHTYLKDSLGNPIWSYFTPGRPPNVLYEAQFLAGKIAKDFMIYGLNLETKFRNIKTKVVLGVFDQDKYLFTTPCVGNFTGCGDREFALTIGGPGTTHNTPGKNYIADIQLSVPVLFKEISFLNNHLFTFGLSYKRGEAKTKQYKLTNWKDENSKTNLLYETEGKDKVFAIFIQDEIPVTEKFMIYLGARQDWWKVFDGYENMISNSGYPRKYSSKSEISFNPKFSFVYNFSKDLKFRGSLGTAFRPPMLIELYRSFMTPASFIYGNPDLKPEKSISWDLGINYNFQTIGKFEVNYFENYVKDLIYNRRTGKYIGMREIVETINAGKAKIKGFEIAYERSWGKYLKTFINLTWNDAKIKDNPANPKSEGKRITGIPETMLNLGIEYERNKFSASLYGRYRSKVYGNDENLDKKEGVFGSYDSYFTVDSKLSYALCKNCLLELSIDNLFDKKYYYYYLQPRRSYFIGFNYKF